MSFWRCVPAGVSYMYPVYRNNINCKELGNKFNHDLDEWLLYTKGNKEIEKISWDNRIM